jgi:hypothetical protein
MEQGQAMGRSYRLMSRHNPQAPSRFDAPRLMALCEKEQNRLSLAWALTKHTVTVTPSLSAVLHAARLRRGDL